MDAVRTYLAENFTKIFFISIAVLVIIIPAGAFLIASRSSQTQEVAPAAPPPVTKGKPNEVPANSPLNDLLKGLEATSGASTTDVAPTPTATPSASISFGPTLSLKLAIEGRAANKQTTKLFIGVVAGSAVSANPTYVLSFTVDIPESGSYDTLSLAGLTQNNTYTAILKSTSQLATSSAFTVRPGVTDIGVVKLLSGDLNEDNVINSQDFSIVKGGIGLTSKDPTWNSNIDINQDGVINTYDVSYVLKNYGITGASGAWMSRVSTGSATLTTPSNIGGPLNEASPSPTPKEAESFGELLR